MSDASYAIHAAQASQPAQAVGRPLVIDAALAVKLVLPEELSNRAHELVEGALAAGRAVVGPPILPADAANAIYAQRRADEVTGSEADAAMAAFHRLGLEVRSPAGLDRAAFAFARAHRVRSVYGAYYLALAQLLGTELWTADRALFKSAAPVAPWVCWIGDYAAG